MNNTSTDNITFSFEEKNTNITNEYDIEKMMEELNEEIDDEINENSNIFNFCENDISYFINKNAYGNDEQYYNEEYTVKELLKICNYYGIEKNVKSSKCKKQDIIETLVYFESLNENAALVEKRNRMWAYISELVNDQKMKKYVIWN